MGKFIFLTCQIHIFFDKPTTNSDLYTTGYGQIVLVANLNHALIRIYTAVVFANVMIVKIIFQKYIISVTKLTSSSDLYAVHYSGGSTSHILCRVGAAGNYGDFSHSSRCVGPFFVSQWLGHSMNVVSRDKERTGNWILVLFPQSVTFFCKRYGAYVLSSRSGGVEDVKRMDP